MVTPRPRDGQAPLTVLTVGHSTRPIEEFIELLRAHQVEGVVDIRTVPRSRHNPQYNREAMPAALQSAGIGYEHLPGLGGLRKARPDSPNAAWKNASFRGYADYMQTADFTQALEHLLELARSRRVAIMCAEAVPWRCHRSLVGDALAARGILVEHLFSAETRQAHRLTAWAALDGDRVTYPAEPDLFS